MTDSAVRPRLDAYLDEYARRVLEGVAAGESCALLGTLGAGKTEVLRRVAASLNARTGVGGACAVYVDAGGERAGLAARGLMLELARGLRPPIEAGEQQDEAELRARLDAWLLRERRDAVLLLDQAELLERPHTIYRVLRALIMLRERHAGADAPGGRFIVVLASTRSLRAELAGATSPLHNLLRHIPMEDCPPGLRREYWAGLLRARGDSERESLIEMLDQLCGGDPYLIEQVGRELAGLLDDPHPPAEGDLARYVDLTFRLNPTGGAPLFTRYGELLDDDPDALRLALRLCANEAVPAREVAAPETGRTAGAWSGLFAARDGRWRFRSGLAGVYLQREFAARPARVASCLRRHRQHADAVAHLARFRGLGRPLLASLDDVMLAWVESAATPGRAWQHVAQMLHTWFNGEAQVLRCSPRARGPASYARVNPGRIETPADPAIADIARRAHAEQSEAPKSARRAALRAWHDAASPPAARWIFPLTREGREYGAVVWSQDAYDSEIEDPEKRQDRLEEWSDLFDRAFGLIEQMERQLLADVDLSRVQRLAQEYRRLEDVEGVLHQILSVITAHTGLDFDRAVLLQAQGNRVLRGRIGLGGHTPSPRRSAPLDVLLSRSPRELSPLPERERTPLHAGTAQFGVDDWHADALLGPALQGADPVAAAPDTLADSALGRLLGGARAQDHPVFIVPLREGSTGAEAGRLQGALIVDKPFTAKPVSQEQLDLLPQLANQLALVLLNEEVQQRRQLFDRISEISIQRWSVQPTLEALTRAILGHFSGLIDQVAVTLWETSDGSDPSFPNRRLSTLRVVAPGQALTGSARDWQFAYYTGDEACRGPIDQALLEGDAGLHISDLEAWEREHADPTGWGACAGMRSVFSIALPTDVPLPRGVMSFHSRAPFAFAPADLEFFKQVAFRATYTIEKARAWEGLTRARRHTERLNRALEELLLPTTKAELCECILQQARAFFEAGVDGSDHSHAPDSAAVLALQAGMVGPLLTGANEAIAIRLASTCPAMFERVMAGHPVFVEHASAELIAREQFADAECARHAEAGAEASAWLRIGREGDQLLVLAWLRPRRINRTERQSLPVLAEIAARTNGVIERERLTMRDQLTHSLKIEDYALIEAEYTHQWNKRIRTLRQYAQYALEDLDDAAPAPAGGPQAIPLDTLSAVRTRLRDIDRLGGEALDRLAFGSQINQARRIALKPFLTGIVERWNLLHGHAAGLACEMDLRMDDARAIETRDIILGSILTELLSNAGDAERRQPPGGRWIELRADYDPQASEYSIRITNSARIPRAELEQMRSRSPLDRPNRSGRGVWLAGGQVSALLAGSLQLPDPQDEHTAVTITLHEKMPD